MKRTKIITLITLVMVCAVLSACGKTAQELVASGDNYMKQKEYDKAAADYKDAIDKDSQYMDAYIGVIEAYRRLKDADSVSAYCKKAYENLSEDQVKSINHKYYSYNLQYVDAIHTAILTAIMDIELCNDSEIDRWVNHTIDISSLKKEDGAITAYALEILGVENGKEAIAPITILGTDSISVKAEVTNDRYTRLKVYVEGYESTLCVE
ncbi:MAG: hypothetical protein K5697_05785 [Lachnospiraceae bacterium]|nr:hypothetical protein [Lachnospiraceae bacterium]